MEWRDIRENWTAMIPSIQARWPEISEERLTAMSGERDELVQAVAETSGSDGVEAEREVDAWLVQPMPADAYADPAHDQQAAQDAGGYVPEGEDPLADDRRFGDEDVPDRPIGRREE
jgi:hypothetical protein